MAYLEAVGSPTGATWDGIALRDFVSEGRDCQSGARGTAFEQPTLMPRQVESDRLIKEGMWTIDHAF